MLRIKNPFNYSHYRKVRYIWLLFTFSYLISQVFLIIDILNREVFFGIGSLIQLIGIGAIIYVAIIVPEWFLLGNVQFLRAVAIIKNLDINNDSMKFPISKIFDYIEYMSNNNIKLSHNINED